MIRFRIANMACGGCAEGATTTIREIDPRAQIQVALERREVVIESTVDPVRLGKVLHEAGWQSEQVAR